MPPSTGTPSSPPSVTRQRASAPVSRTTTGTTGTASSRTSSTLHKTGAGVEHRSTRPTRTPATSKDKKGSTRTSVTSAPEPKEAVTFHADDFNFTGYDLPQLVFLCEHKLVLRTRFPKLVVALYHHPRFATCTAFRYGQRDVTALRQLLVARLVDAIARRTVGSGSEGGRAKKLTLNEELCSQLVHEVLGADDVAIAADAPDAVQTKPARMHTDTAPAEAPTDDMPPTPSRTGRTMKQQHSHQWTDNTHPNLELEVVTSRGSRTRKRHVGQPTLSASLVSHQPERREDPSASKQSVDTHQQRVIQI